MSRRQNLSFLPVIPMMTAFLPAVLSISSSLPAQVAGGCDGCESAPYPIRADVNGDRLTDLSDGVYLLAWLFLGGPAPDCPAGVAPEGVDPEDAAPCCVDCGDANGDEHVDLSDAVRILSWLFVGADRPRCSPLSAPETCDPPIPLVVDGEWLEERLDDDDVQIADARSRGVYETSRIPGALHIDVSSLRATVEGVPGQVAAPAAVEEVFRASGLEKGVTAVVYGNATDTTAARLLWTLHYYGHADALLLDGGWGSWTARERPVASGPADASTSDYAIDGAVEALRVDVDWVAARLDDPDVVLVDARSSGEYASGHIPGALSFDWQRNVSGGAFLPFSEVEELYAGIDRKKTLVTYCQTGSRASVAYLALRWVGFPDVRVYDGSWAEWGSRSGLPRETR